MFRSHRKDPGKWFPSLKNKFNLNSFKNIDEPE